MLYLSEEDVRQLLPMRDAIGLMRSAFEALARGEAINQPRRRLILDTGATLHSMAGSYLNYFGTKFYSTHPRYGAHFYFVLYDAQTAEPLAWMEANHLGQIRTGAAGGYATDLLSNPEAETLGVIGSGFQARTQVEAIRAVRPIKTVRVVEPERGKAAEVRRRMLRSGDGFSGGCRARRTNRDHRHQLAGIRSWKMAGLRPER